MREQEREAFIISKKAELLHKQKEIPAADLYETTEVAFTSYRGMVASQGICYVKGLIICSADSFSSKLQTYNTRVYAKDATTGKSTLLFQLAGLQNIYVYKVGSQELRFCSYGFNEDQSNKLCFHRYSFVNKKLEALGEFILGQPIEQVDSVVRLKGHIALSIQVRDNQQADLYVVEASSFKLVNKKKNLSNLAYMPSEGLLFGLRQSRTQQGLFNLVSLDAQLNASVRLKGIRMYCLIPEVDRIAFVDRLHNVKSYDLMGNKQLLFVAPSTDYIVWDKAFISNGEALFFRVNVEYVDSGTRYQSSVFSGGYSFQKNKTFELQGLDAWTLNYADRGLLIGDSVNSVAVYTLNRL